MYEVLGIVPKNYGNEIAGGDMESLKNFNKKSQAFKFAKKESKNKKWHEITVYTLDDNGDVSGHWYFKKGILTHDMGL